MSALLYLAQPMKRRTAFDPTTSRLYLPALLAAQFQSAAGTPPGTTPVTTALQDVKAWRDYGPNGFHFTESTNNPKCGGTAPPRVKFNGTSQRIWGSSSIVTTNTDAWFAMRFKLNALPASSSTFGVMHLIGPSFFVDLRLCNLTGYQPYSFLIGAAHGTPTSFGIADALTTTDELLLVEKTVDPGTLAVTYKASRAGVDRTVVGSGALVGSAADPSILGSTYYLGNPVEFAPMDLGPVLYGQGVLSNDAKVGVLNLLAAA